MSRKYIAKGNMETDKLITVLAECGACKILPQPKSYALYWFLWVAIYASIFVAYFGLRTDIEEKLLTLSYLLELMLLGLTAFFSALTAFYLSRPDGHHARKSNLIPIVLMMIWAITIYLLGPSLTFADLIKSASLSHFDCPWHIALFSTPPALAILLLSRKAATIHCRAAGGMATLSATALGYLCMRLIEQNDNPAHLLIWHVFPIVLMCVLGTFCGKLLLRWH